ncbi:DUF1622 domain-containing protein [Micromonospora radicis]|uniref:DUF1622 domain-containing protein n=1 Tax=Micromonospora radicis TaxID=1894971 RepID=A0A418N0F7_9ACTN|nr:DUF1622 domain-containing protein [Micromonospora radicis]RIV41312.1 DUF1622 domain-containing protein [Micromonospora radicis]
MTATLSTVITVIGVFAAGIVLVGTRSVPTALGVLLDMLVAAGLVRLVGEQTWADLAGVVAIVLLRTVLRGALLADYRRSHPGATVRSRRPGRR